MEPALALGVSVAVTRMRCGASAEPHVEHCKGDLLSSSVANALSTALPVLLVNPSRSYTPACGISRTLEPEWTVVKGILLMADNWVYTAVPHF